MRGHIIYRGSRYVLAQDPPDEAPKPEDEPEVPAEDAPVDPDATVDDELEGEAAPEDAERGQNLSELGLGGGDAPEGEGTEESPEPEDPGEVSRELDKSPASNWKKYEQPILKDIRRQFGGVPISLLNPHIESDVDVDLGFHITGYVKFLGDIPHTILDEYGDAPLHFKVFIDPEGKFQRSSLTFYTELDNY
jgi:hypothetical protein